jgi:hypothetical protein
VTTWNDTLRTLFHEGAGYAIRERQWREKFEQNDAAWFCLVVERPTAASGFRTRQPERHPDFAGQLNKIYLLRDYQRVGLGRV